MNRFIVIIIGIVLLTAGAFLLIKNNMLIKNCTVEAEATVVDMDQEYSADDGGDYMYYPIIEYKVGEETVRATMSKGSGTPEYNINDKIAILYNPDNTEEFIVKGESSSKLISILFIALGVLVTGIGVKTAITFKKDPANENKTVKDD